MLIDSFFTRVIRSDQAYHRGITGLGPIAGGLESGKSTDGLQKPGAWPDVVSVQATSSKAVSDTTISSELARLTKAHENHQYLLAYFGPCGGAYHTRDVTIQVTLPAFTVPCLKHAGTSAHPYQP